MAIDKEPRIVFAKPDIEAVKQARRWLRGAAMLLADAANGSPMIEQIARETSTVALMAEVAVLEYSEDPEPPSA